jgi:hypothetical protein
VNCNAKKKNKLDESERKNRLGSNPSNDEWNKTQNNARQDYQIIILIASKNDGTYENIGKKFAPCELF